MKLHFIIYITIFLVFTQFIISGLEIKNYEPELIKAISWDYLEPEELGEGSLPKGPTAFTISEDAYIYICDTWRYRIAVYDLSLNFVKELKKTKNYESYIYLSESMYVNNNLYLVRNDGKLVTLNKNGEKIYEIKGNKWIGSMHWQENYFPFNDYVFYYTNGGGIKAINPAGNVIYEAQTKEILKNIDGWHEGFFYQNKEQEMKIKKYLVDNNLIFINGKLYHGNFDIHKKYFDFLANNLNKADKKDKTRFDMKAFDPFRLIGFDNDNNEYWIVWKHITSKESEAVIIAISNKGELLDCFPLPHSVKVAVAPSGDIYGMKIDEHNCKFYKITRRWALEQEEDTTIPIEDVPPKALSITATSFIDWKNTYTPAKAFDGNLKTGWLEAAKDAGIGESITLSLDKDIIIDKITIAPGYFDPKWWKANNRVKKLKITYGDKSKTIQFRDEMIKQSITLEGGITFSKITFEIMDVYSSGKDNDTGISEIEFYYKGEKVEIDVGGVK